MLAAKQGGAVLTSEGADFLRRIDAKAQKEMAEKAKGKGPLASGGIKKSSGKK